jgi:NarL family two-component system response regulator LiaR
VPSVKPKDHCQTVAGRIRGLTDREKEVLRCLQQGATNQEIAARLRISGHTVKTHLDHIFRKLNVHNRTQAAVKAGRLK